MYKVNLCLCIEGTCELATTNTLKNMLMLHFSPVLITITRETKLKVVVAQFITNLPAVAIETQEDLVSQHSLEFSIVRPHASVNSNTQIPVSMISQCHLFIHPPLEWCWICTCITKLTQYTCWWGFGEKKASRTWGIIALREIIGERTHHKFYRGIKTWGARTWENTTYDVFRFYIKTVHLTDLIPIS